MVKVSEILDDIGIPYKELGEDYRVNCWHHPEKKPSMFINKENGVFHCFSCGSSGNILNILNQHLGLTGMEALVYLGNFYDKRESDAEFRIRQFKEETLGPRNKNKLLERKFVEMPKFSPLRLHPYLINRGFTCGEIIQWKMGKVDTVQPNDKFAGYANWIIIPIYHFGKLRNYFMRSPFSNRKIYGSHSIKDVLFGYDAAQDFSKPVYVVEGIFDMIKLRRTGVQVVASLTNRLYEPQYKLLKKYSKIIIVPDNDVPGLRLVIDALPMVNSKIVKVCLVPDGKKDTGDCNLEELNNMIASEFDIVEYVTELQYATKFGKGNWK